VNGVTRTARGPADKVAGSLYFSHRMSEAGRISRSRAMAPGGTRRRCTRACLAVAAALALAAPALGQGRSGIPAIDSLPLHDWRAPGPPLSYGKAFAFSLLPGGGQFYGGHPVRGGFLVGLEALLIGVSASSWFMDLPRWREEADDALDAADSLYLETLANPGRAATLEAQRLEQVGLARERADLVARQTDLARSQVAWAAGLHAYGMLDAMEIVYLSRHPDGVDRSVRAAMYRGLFFPGGGQIYNRRYGKFGLLWMALGASAVSAWSRQEMVEKLNGDLETARAEAAANPAARDEVEDLERDRTLYRKRRNQYFWGMAILYIYAVMDGMVDAALSDFDAPSRFAMSMEPEGTVALRLNLPF